MKIRLALLCGAMLFASTGQAQNSDVNVEGRVKKLEKEMQAVQRVAFPNGAGKMIQPELTSPDPAKPATTGANSAVSDLLTRVDALEGQLSTLTGQIETQANQQKALETRIKALETAMKEQAAAKVAEVEPAPVKVADRPVVTTPKPAVTPAKTTATTSRAAAVAKVVKPKTTDAGEDSYMYGYNLWEAKFYPEAEVQLAATLAKYPSHKRATFARNLMGRAILDDGRPSKAVGVLYDNYKNHSDGERAPESLYYLGVALTKLDKRTEACQTFKELADAYPEAVEARLSGKLSEGRAAAKCK